MLQQVALRTARALRNERMKPKELQILVDKKVRAIVEFAYRRVPFYHHLFKEKGVHPSEILSAEDLQRVPFTTKDDVRKHGHQMLAHGVNKEQIIWRRTSGTSGRPVLIAKDRQARLTRLAMHARYNLAIRTMPWDKMAHIVHSRSDPAQREDEPLGLLGGFRGKFQRLVFLDNMSHLERVIQELHRYKPSLLVSHAFNLRIVALYTWRNPRSIKPDAIRTGAGEVADRKTVELLEEAFGCPVYGLYGAREVGPLGFECSHRQGYHVNVDHVYAEYISQGQAVSEGEIGETVWTTLDNYAMPFIRYRLGDLAVPTDERCSCGRSLPLLRSIEGRRSDLVILPDRSIVTPAQILAELNQVRGAARFQLRQTTLDHFDIQYAPSIHYSSQTEEEILTRCSRILGRDVTIHIHEGNLESFPVKWSPVTTDVPESSAFSCF